MIGGLGRNIKAMQMDQEIHGIQFHPRTNYQTHQQFVEDTMLMGHSLIQEYQVIKRWLLEFGKYLGHEINGRKSQVLSFNTLRIIRSNIF